MSNPSCWMNQPFYQIHTSQSLIVNDLMIPFADTDGLILEASQSGRQYIHFWQTPPTLILGMMDTRLPYFDQARDFVHRETNLQMVVRNSGGLGVISDPDVLNVTLFFPQKEERITINDGYERMLWLIRQMIQILAPKSEVEVGEVADSYCPGDYDLSLKGKKFAGISQRRLEHGLAVMIYLSVTGNQAKRAHVMKDFYTVGIQEAETKWSYPCVRPDAMTTLADALEYPNLTVDQMSNILADILKIELTKPSSDFQANYQTAYDKMQKRNLQFL